MRRAFCITAALCLAAPAASETVCPGKTSGPISASNHYDVFRNGGKVGEHTLRFEKSGAHITVESETFMQVKVLFVSAFNYEYVSRETWCGSTLISAATQTYSNGKNFTSDVSAFEQGYSIASNANGTQSETFVTAPVVPSNHWNQAALQQPALFDTVKAYNFPITVSQSANPNGEGFEGQRYEVSGDYNYVTYYENRHWQGMAFYRGKKNFIEFRCTDCKNTLWPDRIAVGE